MDRRALKTGEAIHEALFAMPKIIIFKEGATEHVL